ncbi:hypothetical protein GP2_013_00110 [Gordonia paraffinivorans NBRC 108238]|uniref:Uncharacterized protein n=1 Tax=Gordonia paraffinivorans NBRC 108238 TaxID=1223543 RepID=A0ABQ0IIW3_9ACTN|nr:hypothetical protein GP2_013_00110 [Gordonia paraffinivorans NBRC 108238]
MGEQVNRLVTGGFLLSRAWHVPDMCQIHLDRVTKTAPVGAGTPSRASDTPEAIPMHRSPTLTVLATVLATLALYFVPLAALAACIELGWYAA